MIIRARRAAFGTILVAITLAAACSGHATSVAPALGLGKLAYVQAGDIWLKALPDGAPQRITHGGLVSTPKWSPSGEWLLYKSGDQARVIRADGTDGRALNGTAVWAPSDDRLAVLRSDTSIVVEAADGSSPTLIVAGADVSGATTQRAGLLWSPDGKSLAYSETSRATSGPAIAIAAGLWLANLPSSGAEEPVVREIYRPDAVESKPGAPPTADSVFTLGWSPDGGAVLFGLSSGADTADGLPLDVLRTAAASLVQVVPKQPASLLFPTWFAPAPRGDLVAIVDGGGRASWSNKQIAVLSWAAGTLTERTSPAVAATDPAWSPDGTRLAYVAMPGAGPAVAGGDAAKAALAQRKIWAMDADGSNQHALTDDAAYRDEYPQWSADGSRILFVRLDVHDNASIWTMSSNGGERRAVVPGFDPSTLRTDAAWLGYFGHISWDNVMDWWRGAPGAADGAGAR